jgi:branched-chain amino acid transport system permease protein
MTDPMGDILSILPQQLVFGLALGTVYGLIALGYTMVYGVLLMINFAHGEVFMIGAYIGWAVLAFLLNHAASSLHPIWVLPALLLPAMLMCGLLGMTIERFAYRPLYSRGGSRLAPLISAFGASIFLQNAVMLTQGARMKVYMTNTLFPRNWRFDIFGVNISILVVVMVAVSLALTWGLIMLVQKTTLGRSIRAVSEDREMASVMGVNVGHVIGLTFFLGSALGGAAGVLVGLYYTQIDFVMGYSAGLKAFTAAVLGGIGNIKGAMVGGLLLGVIESAAVTFINPAFKDVIAFAVLILVLMFRPEGIFGEALSDRKKV